MAPPTQHPDYRKMVLWAMGKLKSESSGWRGGHPIYRTDVKHLLDESYPGLLPPRGNSMLSQAFTHLVKHGLLKKCDPDRGYYDLTEAATPFIPKTRPPKIPVPSGSAFAWAEGDDQGSGLAAAPEAYVEDELEEEGEAWEESVKKEEEDEVVLMEVEEDVKAASKGKKGKGVGVPKAPYGTRSSVTTTAGVPPPPPSSSRAPVPQGGGSVPKPSKLQPRRGPPRREWEGSSCGRHRATVFIDILSDDHGDTDEEYYY